MLRDDSGVGTWRLLDTSRDVFNGGQGDDLIYASQHDCESGGSGDDTI
jgi:hypothetical protein